MMRISMLPQRVWMVMLLLFLASTSSLLSQSLTLFDIDASAYPVMRAKFYAFDKDGNQVSGLAPGDLQLREDGIARTVTRVSCPAAPPPQALSSVLTIDISSSMASPTSGPRMQMAKSAARAWIGALLLGRSECAVTSFNDRAFVNQDFTTDRAALLMAVDALHADGMTNYNAALLTPPAGALEVCKGARSKRVVVFLSDGLPNSSPYQSAIIAEALRQNATIYAVMLDMPAPQSLKKICAATGGMYFEYVNTEAEATDIYLRILQHTQGGDPCELEWTTDGCATTRMLEVMLTSPVVSATAQFVVPSSMLPQIIYTPSRSLHFGEVMPGTQPRQQVTLTAHLTALRIERVTVDNPRFRIVDYGGAAPPFTLGSGQSRTLRVEFAPTDSTYSFCRIEVQSVACSGMSFYADGGWRGKFAPHVTVRVVHPNGGEHLLAGSETELIWEGVMPEESVRLEYSVDGGASWKRISNEATGLRHPWRVPKQPSDRCLLRVSTVRRPVFIGDMALIPPGTFRMGNITGHRDGWGDEKPVHEVAITRAFLMSRTEVTQAKYEAVMGTNPSTWKLPDHPVALVNWYMAVEFCNALSRREGLDICYSGSGANTVCDFTANGYRLPTEAEWEYACRAGTETDFHNGNLTATETSLHDPALDLAGWYYGNSGSSTHPVGQKEPNDFGLHDMHGNVNEWCWDWNGTDSYASSPVDDPRGPSSGNRRVIRGGACSNVARFCRSASRASARPESSGDSGGFRVVRTY
jgi:formylglycine-generating enzyme required for sulfatase activity